MSLQGQIGDRVYASGYLDVTSFTRLSRTSRAMHLMVNFGHATLVDGQGDSQEIQSMLKIAGIVQEYANERKLHNEEFLSLAPIILGYAGIDIHDGRFNPIDFAAEISCRAPRANSLLKHLEPRMRCHLLEEYQSKGSVEASRYAFECYATLSAISPENPDQATRPNFSNLNTQQVALKFQKILAFFNTLPSDERSCIIRSLTNNRDKSLTNLQRILIKLMVTSEGVADRCLLLRNYGNCDRDWTFTILSEYPFLSNDRHQNLIMDFFMYFNSSEMGPAKKIDTAHRLLSSRSVSQWTYETCLNHAFRSENLELIYTLFETTKCVSLDNANIALMACKDLELIKVVAESMSEEQRATLLNWSFSYGGGLTSDAARALVFTVGPIPDTLRCEAFERALREKKAYEPALDEEESTRYFSLLYDPQLKNLHDLQKKLAFLPKNIVGDKVLRQIIDRQPRVTRFTAADTVTIHEDYFAYDPTN